jgi:hypothetical protein
MIEYGPGKDGIFVAKTAPELLECKLKPGILFLISATSLSKNNTTSILTKH